jgi:hypothetical protein
MEEPAEEGGESSTALSVLGPSDGPVAEASRGVSMTWWELGSTSSCIGSGSPAPDREEGEEEGEGRGERCRRFGDATREEGGREARRTI